MLPIVEPDGRLTGCVTMQQIKSVPRQQWATLTVRNVATSCAAANTVDPDADALKVLGLMNRTRVTRVMVARDGRLLGILSLRDLLRFLAVKMELEGGDSRDLSAAQLHGRDADT